MVLSYLQLPLWSLPKYRQERDNAIHITHKGISLNDVAYWCALLSNAAYSLPIGQDGHGISFRKRFFDRFRTDKPPKNYSGERLMEDLKLSAKNHPEYIDKIHRLSVLKSIG